MHANLQCEFCHRLSIDGGITQSRIDFGNESEMRIVSYGKVRELSLPGNTRWRWWRLAYLKSTRRYTMIHEVINLFLRFECETNGVCRFPRRPVFWSAKMNRQHVMCVRVAKKKEREREREREREVGPRYRKSWFDKNPAGSGVDLVLELLKFLREFIRHCSVQVYHLSRFTNLPFIDFLFTVSGVPKIIPI